MNWLSGILHRLNGRLPRPKNIKAKRYTSSGVPGDEFYAHAYNTQVR